MHFLSILSLKVWGVYTGLLSVINNLSVLVNEEKMVLMEKNHSRARAETGNAYLSDFVNVSNNNGSNLYRTCVKLLYN